MAISCPALRAGGEEVGRGCALPFRRRSLVARAGVGAFVFAGVRQPLDTHHVLVRTGAEDDHARRVAADHADLGDRGADQLALVGDQLYVANTDALVRFPYVTGATRIDAAAVKVVDLPAGTLNHHWTKNVIASRDGRQLYVTVGSNSNVGENGMDKDSGSSGNNEDSERTFQTIKQDCRETDAKNANEYPV